MHVPQKRLRGHRSIAVQVRNWFIVFGVVPATLVLLLCLSLAQQYSLRVTEESLRQSSENMDAEFADLLGGYMDMVSMLAKSEDVQAAMAQEPGSHASVPKLVQNLLAFSEERVQVHLLSINNGYRYSTGAIPALYTMPVYRNYGIFRQAREVPGEIVMKTTVYTSYNKERMAIALCRAVWGDMASEEPVGFVVVSIPQSVLRGLVMKFKPVSMYDMVVLDVAGAVAYSMLHPENEGVILRDEGFLEAMAQEENKGGWLERDGRYYAIVEIGGTGFRVGISVSRDLSNAIMTGIREVGIYILIVTVSLALLVGVFLSRRIGSQLQRLIAVFEHTERGEFDERFVAEKRDYYDIALLGAYYNELIEEVRSLLERSVEAQTLLATAELKALESQIKPHFIYNTLNDIKALSKLGRNQEINEMVIAFSRLLRSSLTATDAFITVGEDLELIESYINMQNIRFAGAVHVRMDVEPSLMQAEIPRLMLQPLVENAFIHGFSNHRRQPVLCLRGYRSGGGIVFEVIDNGGGIAAKKREEQEGGLMLHEGTGLKNIASRLKQYYQEDGRLNIRTKHGCYTKVTLTLNAERPVFAAQVE